MLKKERIEFDTLKYISQYYQLDYLVLRNIIGWKMVLKLFLRAKYCGGKRGGEVQRWMCNWRLRAGLRKVSRTGLKLRMAAGKDPHFGKRVRTINL
jgi:hypothetical protein